MCSNADHAKLGSAFAGDSEDDVLRWFVNSYGDLPHGRGSRAAGNALPMEKRVSQSATGFGADSYCLSRCVIGWINAEGRYAFFTLAETLAHTAQYVKSQSTAFTYPRKL